MVCVIWCFATGSVRHWERAIGRLAGCLVHPIVCRVIIGSGCGQSREDKCSGEMSFGWVLVRFLKGIAVDSKRRGVYPMPHDQQGTGFQSENKKREQPNTFETFRQICSFDNNRTEQFTQTKGKSTKHWCECRKSEETESLIHGKQFKAAVNPTKLKAWSN